VHFKNITDKNYKDFLECLFFTSPKLPTDLLTPLSSIPLIQLTNPSPFNPIEYLAPIITSRTLYQIKE